MRKIVVTEYVSLDGVMDEPGTWSFPFWADDIATFKFEELVASDAQLLGRVTYQGFAAAWPSMTDEQGFADRMNGMPKYVVSTTLDTAEWENSHLIRGDVAAEVATLKRQPGRDILVAGSGMLVQELIQQDLVDEYHLLVHPIVLGGGKRLFRDGSGIALRLVQTTTFGSGVVLLVYRPALRA